MNSKLVELLVKIVSFLSKNDKSKLSSVMNMVEGTLPEYAQYLKPLAGGGLDKIGGALGGLSSLGGLNPSKLMNFGKEEVKEDVSASSLNTEITNMIQSKLLGEKENNLLSGIFNLLK